jgi:hypothetical protein
VCPGQHLATKSLFISTVFALWSFQLSVDESKPADDMGFLNGGLGDVSPISFHFKPRMAKEKLMVMMEE